MAKRNTHRNKCMTCGEHYKSFHMCKVNSQAFFDWRFIKFTEVSNPESWGDVEVSGTEYARRKPVDDFDDWFTSIEEYIEGKLAC